MKRLRVVLVGAVIAAGLMIGGPAPEARASGGTGPYAQVHGYGGYVYVAFDGKRRVLSVNRFGCAATVKLGALEALPNATLEKASVQKATPCGFVSFQWNAWSDLLVGTGGVYRYAYATGTIGGYSITHTKTDAQLGIGTLAS